MGYLSIMGLASAQPVACLRASVRTRHQDYCEADSRIEPTGRNWPRKSTLQSEGCSDPMMPLCISVQKDRKLGGYSIYRANPLDFAER
jgi:hypothetical protein